MPRKKVKMVIRLPTEPPFEEMPTEPYCPNNRGGDPYSERVES